MKARSGNNIWLIIAVIGVILPIALLITRAAGGDVEGGAELLYLTIGLVSGVIYWATYKKAFFLVQPGNTNPIEFLIDKPSKDDVDQFIESLKQKRNDVLDAKYGTVNIHLPYDKNHENLTWLCTNGVISKEEFDKRISDLNLKFHRASAGKIGFEIGGRDIGKF